MILMNVYTKYSKRFQLVAALLFALLMPQMSFADNVSLQIDNDYDAGDVRHHYVNLPHNGRNTLILDGTVSSFKVYDDGGGKIGGNIGYDCNSWLEIQAPEGYVLRINGFMTASQYDRFCLYDGSSDTDYALVDEMEVYDNVSTAIGQHMSSGRRLLLHFWANGTRMYDGLNLTVELVPATVEHQIQIIGVEGCAVTANKTSAKAGELITLTIEESPGYRFVGMRVHAEPRNIDETVCFRTESTWYNPGDNTVTFSMPNTTATVIPVVIYGYYLSADDGLYIDMPTHGTKRVYLMSNVPSVKIYDDAGGGDAFKGLGNNLGYFHNYSRCCDSYLKLEAPEGYVMKLTGTMDTQYGDYLTVYDGSSQWYSNKLADKLGLESGEVNVGTIVSSSNEMMLYFRSGDSPTHVGLDLKVEVMLPVQFTGNGTAQEPYLIQNADDWTRFCSALQDNDTWNHFDGKHLKLCDDIYVSAMAGSYGHEFMGIFDGDNHTITFNNYSVEDTIAAPFRYVAGTTTTIKNLNIAGRIYSSTNYAAGLIGSQQGNAHIDSCVVDMQIDGQKYLTQFVARANGITTITASTAKGYLFASGKYAAGFVAQAIGTVNITNCVSNTYINSWVDGDGTHGGFVGENQRSSTVNIEGCLFDGLFISANTSSCAGFVGWRNNEVNISNSLFIPTTNGFVSQGSATFCRNTPSSITNCYYSETLGDSQGKMMRTIVGDNVTVDNAGTATEYGVSGITSYGTGILYKDILYAGVDDQVLLDLAYTGTDEISGFTANAGQLTGVQNPYTLTMPDENVTITANVKQSMPGDVNGDNTVDISDVNAVINIILETKTQDDFPGDADLTGDGVIDVSDVNAIINIILAN